MGDLQLLVIGQYRMGVEITPEGRLTRLLVFIDYDLPPANTWLGRLFGRMYARWCVAQMTKGARDHFPTDQAV